MFFNGFRGLPPRPPVPAPKPPGRWRTLHDLSEALGLPEEYLQKCSDNGTIPYLLVDDDRLYNIDDVHGRLIRWTNAASLTAAVEDTA